MCSRLYKTRRFVLRPMVYLRLLLLQIVSIVSAGVSLAYHVAPVVVLTGVTPVACREGRTISIIGTRYASGRCPPPYGVPSVFVVTNSLYGAGAARRPMVYLLFCCYR